MIGLAVTAVGAIINEVKPHKSFVFHTEILVLFGLLGVGLPIFSYFVWRLGRAGSEQRDEAEAENSRLWQELAAVMEKSRSDLQRYEWEQEDNFRSYLVLFRDDFFDLRERAVKASKFGDKWRGQGWEPARTHGFVQPESNVISLSRRIGDEGLYRAVAGVYRAVHDIRTLANQVYVAPQGTIPTDEKVLPVGADPKALFAALIKRIDVAAPLVDGALAQVEDAIKSR